MTLTRKIPAVLFHLSLLAGCLGWSSQCWAIFHLWQFKEVYSNADGSVQFIELFTTFSSQQFLSGHTLTSSTNTFNFTNSPSPTNNRHLLLATPGFASLPGGVTPNYTIPANFFNPVADTLNFGEGSDIRVLNNIPTDGVNSINYPSGTSAANSPTNFAGQTGSLMLATPGDFDGDGNIDGRDFLLWQRDTNVGDLADWQANYGAGATAGLSSSVVPEPTTIGLLLVGMLVALRRPGTVDRAKSIDFVLRRGP
jgi:hypothetical protein